LELNPTTFLLEILNFLILIWILQRFLYKPVRDVVARRQEAVGRTLREAETVRQEAGALQERYQSRLQQWEQEKQAARLGLKAELDEDRDRALAAIEQELAGARERAEALEQKRRADCIREYRRLGLEQGNRFAGRLLAELASPELEARLLQMALERLASLPESTLDGIRVACETSPEEAAVVTAYPLAAASRGLLQQRLGEMLGLAVACRFSEDPGLLAGLSVTVGPWVFQANLRDELKAFADAAHAAD